MNLSPARLVVLVALVVGGVAVLLNGFSSDGDTAAVAGGRSPSPIVALTPTSTASPTGTPTDTPKTPKPEVEGVTFAVFNATATTGLGAEVEQLVAAEGYEVTQPAGNADTTGLARTVVYFRGGEDAAQAKSNATRLAEDLLNGAEVKLLGAEFESAVPDTTQLVVVVGADYPGATA